VGLVSKPRGVQKLIGVGSPPNFDPHLPREREPGGQGNDRRGRSRWRPRRQTAGRREMELRSISTGRALPAGRPVVAARVSWAGSPARSPRPQRVISHLAGGGLHAEASAALVRPEMTGIWQVMQVSWPPARRNRNIVEGVLQDQIGAFDDAAVVVQVEVDWWQLGASIPLGERPDARLGGVREVGVGIAERPEEVYFRRPSWPGRKC